MAFLDDKVGLPELWRLICEKHNGFVNEHIWERTFETSSKIPAGYTLGDVQSDVLTYRTVQGGNDTANYSYADNITVADDGTVSLVNPTSVTLRFGIDNAQFYNWSALVGKYIMAINGAGALLTGKGVYYIPSDATFDYYNSIDTTYYYIGVSKAHHVDGYAAIPAGTYVDYVNSPDINAYPPAEGDDRTYEYLGQMGAKTRIACGSYTGTGKYGGSNRNSLTFNFKPALVQVFAPTSGGRIFTIPPVNGQAATTESNGYRMSVEWNGNTVYWSSGRDAFDQLNNSGEKYYYLAFCAN